MQVPNETGPGVQRSKLPLLASRTHRKYSMENCRNLVIRSKLVIRSSSVQGHELVKCLIDGGCHCIWSCTRMSFNIWGRETLDCLMISAIKFHKRRFQIFLDISLSENLIWKSSRLKNKTFTGGASHGISFELSTKTP